jgi:hypothetical protein
VALIRTTRRHFPEDDNHQGIPILLILQLSFLSISYPLILEYRCPDITVALLPLAVTALCAEWFYIYTYTHTLKKWGKAIPVTGSGGP